MWSLYGTQFATAPVQLSSVQGSFKGMLEGMAIAIFGSTSPREHLRVMSHCDISAEQT